jgi:hypothetical protein
MHKLIFANMLLFISGCLMHAQNLDEVVSKHLDAMGGAKRLRAVQTMSMERVDAGDLQRAIPSLPIGSAATSFVWKPLT